jgi:hypothetical protein
MLSNKCDKLREKLDDTKTVFGSSSKHPNKNGHFALRVYRSFTRIDTALLAQLMEHFSSSWLPGTLIETPRGMLPKSGIHQSVV